MMKRKKGKTKSVGVAPCHSACWSGAYTWPQLPGLLTITMAAIVSPRKASSDVRRGAPGMGRMIGRRRPAAAPSSELHSRSMALPRAAALSVAHIGDEVLEALELLRRGAGTRAHS